MNSNFPKKLKSEDGFIAIIAIGIFTLLALFGFMVHSVYRSTVSSIIRTNNFIAAQDLNNSLVEMIQFDLEKRGPGYNSGNVDCKFVDGELQGATFNEQDSPPGTRVFDTVCNSFSDLIPEGKNVAISFELEGSSLEPLASSLCQDNDSGLDFGDACYVATRYLHQTGNEFCRNYPEPDENGQIVIDPENNTTVDQLNLSCNWGVLRRGDQFSKEVSIPLYFDASSINDADKSIKNVFNDSSGSFSSDGFILRLRTPCPQQDQVCSSDERFVVDAANSAPDVVQWLLTADCEGNSCTLTPFEASHISGESVNDAKDSNNSVVLQSQMRTSNLDSANNQFIANPIFFDDTQVGAVPELESFLNAVEEPVLTLSISPNIIDENGDPIPFLEYQLLTSKPVTAQNTIVKTKVVVDGNVFQGQYAFSRSSGTVNSVLQF